MSINTNTKFYFPDAKEHSVYEDVIDIFNRVDTQGKKFPEKVITHMEYFDNMKAAFNNSYIGTVYEIVFLSALLDEGIPTDKITYHFKTDMRAEIDIIVCDTGFFLKTSLRERWKQIDRDSIVLQATESKLMDARFVAVSYKEHRDKSIDYNIKAAHRPNEYKYGNVEFVSIYDQGTIESIVLDCLHQARR